MMTRSLLSQAAIVTCIVLTHSYLQQLSCEINSRDYGVMLITMIVVDVSPLRSITACVIGGSSGEIYVEYAIVIFIESSVWYLPISFLCLRTLLNSHTYTDSLDGYKCTTAHPSPICPVNTNHFPHNEKDEFFLAFHTSPHSGFFFRFL